MLDNICYVDQETLHERLLLIHDSSPSIYNSRLKGGNTTISANEYIQLNTRAKEILQSTPCEPNHRGNITTQPSHL